MKHQRGRTIDIESLEELDARVRAGASGRSSRPWRRADGWERMVHLVDDVSEVARFLGRYAGVNDKH